MIKPLFLISLFLFVALACSRQEDIYGTFINAQSQEITIDCKHHISSTHLSGEPFMPNNGDEIKLMTTEINNDEITLTFLWDSITSPFAKWNTNSDELSIGTDIYSRKSFATCK